MSYAKAGLGGYADGTSYSLNPALTLYDVRLLASYEILTLGQATPVRLAVGPMLQVWSGDAIIDTQTRLGGAAAITMGCADLGERRRHRLGKPRGGRKPL